MNQKLSLIIPIYNEEQHLAEFLQKVDALELEVPKELVIIDDCSTDNSQKIVETFDFKSEYQYHKQPVNQGKGAALRLGIQKATGSFIGIQDADFEYDMADVPQILSLLAHNKADVVYGSRFKKNSYQVHRTFHYLVNRFLTVLSNFMSGLYLSDMETCYKFFKADIIKNIELTSNRFGFEPEVTAKIARLKIRVAEVPISYFPRNYFEGKKITWKDGVAAIRHIFVYNLSSRKQSFLKSHLPKQYIANSSQWL